MSGHSKWSNNKYRKKSQDYKKSKIFTKIIRELTSAVLSGGNNPSYNPKLRFLIDKALFNNMNMETIKKTISINSDEKEMKNFVYEGYGPGGVAIIVECLSNNKNRIISDIRYAFNKAGGHLSNDKSVSYLFKRIGVISFSSKVNKDKLINIAAKLEIEDLLIHKNGIVELFTNWKKIFYIKKEFDNNGLKPEKYKTTMIATNNIKIDELIQKKLVNLINQINLCPNIKNIYHNGIFY